MNSVVTAAAALLLVTASFLAHAAGESSWQPVVHDDEDEWSLKRDSLSATRTDAGTTITIDGRMRSKKTQHIDLVRWSITLKDCHADAGKLITADLPGTHVVPFDFVKGAGTFESITAQTLCSVYFNDNK